MCIMTINPSIGGYMSYKNKDRLREYDKNYQRQYRQDKKARGECRRCKSPVFKSHSVCEKHLDEQRVTPEVKHGYNLKARYRVPKGVYFDLFDKQEGRCAICGRHQKELKHKLSLDHDHATGVIRGLLCDYVIVP